MALVDMLEENKKIIKKPLLKNIEIEDIEVNEFNKESITEIEELKTSIMTVGLMKPLEVYAKDDGSYKLLGGERRYTALTELIEENKYDSEVPCLVYKVKNEVCERMQILLSNAQRPQTKEADLRKVKEVLELLELEPTLKGKGVLTRDFVAGFLGCKGRTAQNLINEVTGKSNKKSEPLKEVTSDDFKKFLVKSNKDLKHLLNDMKDIEKKQVVTTETGTTVTIEDMMLKLSKIQEVYLNKFI